MAEDLLKNRFLELGERAYQKQIYTYTGFLSQAEQSEFLTVARRLAHVPYSLFGGVEGCERRVLCFGSEELCGYPPEPPIRCMEVRPLSPKFAEALTHRDVLGSLMGLGIKRSAIGDIVLRKDCIYFFCLENMAQYLEENFLQIRRTQVSCRPAERLPEGELYTLREATVQVSSARIDAVIAHAWHLSRSACAPLFREERVFVNSAVCTSMSKEPREGDVISVRGCGRLKVLGVQGLSKKGKLNLRIAFFEQNT